MNARRTPAPDLPRWIARRVPYRRTCVEVGHERLPMHVMETTPPRTRRADAGKTVLMLHGNPTWGFLYRKVVAALRGAPLNIVLPDLIGLGYSARLPDPSEHTVANHARWIGDLIDALELDDIIFVGQDWGGPIGLRALAERRDRVAGLVILNTVVGPPKEGFRPTLFHRLSHMPVVSDLLFRGLGFPQIALWAAQGDKSSIRGSVARAYRAPLRGWRRNAAPLALARMVPDSMAHPSVEELRRVREYVDAFDGPAAIVWGEKDPILGRLRRRAERVLPQASVTKTSAGHFLQEEVPGPIASAIRQVASRRPAP